MVGLVNLPPKRYHVISTNKRFWSSLNTMKFVIKLLKNLRETERVLGITQLWNMSIPCFNLPSKTLLHLPHPQHLIRQSKQIVQFFKWPVSHVKGKILTCNFPKLTRSLQWDPLSMSRCAVWRLNETNGQDRSGICILQNRTWKPMVDGSKGVSKHLLH